MPLKPISQPRNQSGGGCELTWNNGTANRLNSQLKQKQKVVDSECLRLCSPLIPFRTGTLERSGTISTVIGSGEIRYGVTYARQQYYSTTSRSYDANRGGKWFARMKTANKKHIERLING